MENIIFSTQKDIILNENLLLIVVEDECNTMSEFYRLLSTTLHFPNYFHENLDSLDEVLCDLNWIPQDTIQIHFKNIKQFLKRHSKRDDLFELLANVQNCWSEDGTKKIVLSRESEVV